jgi:hypothetical protein
MASQFQGIHCRRTR